MPRLDIRVLGNSFHWHDAKTPSMSCFIAVYSSSKMILKDFFYKYDRSTDQLHDKEKQTCELDLWASQIPCNTMQHGATCGNMRSNGAIPHHCTTEPSESVSLNRTICNFFGTCWYAYLVPSEQYISHSISSTIDFWLSKVPPSCSP